MTATPFAALSDPQLASLRDLLGAALRASPELAHGDALKLVADAEAEAAERGQSRLPGVDAPALTPAPIGSAELVSALARAALAVRPEITSTTKWAEVDRLIARALGISAEAVYVTSVGGLSRNITVRLAQSRRAREASVAAVIWTVGTESLHQAVAATTRACLDIPRLTLVFTVDGSHFDLAAIVTPPSLPAPPALTLAYPTAQRLAATTEAATHD